MEWIAKWKHGVFPSKGSGLACLVIVLCACVVLQILGLPVTLLTVSDSDELLKSEPVSEDFSTLSLVSFPQAQFRPIGVVEFLSVAKPLVLPTSLFHPPVA